LTLRGRGEERRRRMKMKDLFIIVDDGEVSRGENNTA
jgi:hypothetical protein